mgnify:CR=1 FL=1
MLVFECEGSYHRKIVVAINKEECKVCHKLTDCLDVDDSEGEYAGLIVCKPCIDKFFKKLNQ